MGVFGPYILIFIIVIIIRFIFKLGEGEQKDNNSIYQRPQDDLSHREFADFVEKNSTKLSNYFTKIHGAKDNSSSGTWRTKYYSIYKQEGMMGEGFIDVKDIIKNKTITIHYDYSHHQGFDFDVNDY